MQNAPTRRKAIITGASSGIGKATAIAFAQAKIDLCLISRSQQKLEEVSSLVSQHGGIVKILPMDLADLSTVKPKIQEIIREFGGIDILVNNAGLGYTNLLRETPLEDWQQVLDLNLTSVFQCIQAVLPTMRQQGQGTIINLASIAADNFFPEWGTYSVSKAALVALSRCLAVEERSNGIRVTTISPGAVNTPIWDTETVHADFERSAMLSPETVAQTILQAVLLPDEAVIEQLTVTPSIGAL
jgi:short-subunit dehydrogenase